MTDGPVIRNLGSLVTDVRGELRDILDALYEYERGMPSAGPPEDVEKLVTIVEMKVRRAMELLTGSRD